MERAKKSLTWLGHNCFTFTFNDVKFVVDPFLVKGVSPVKAAEISADYVLVSHGHADHCTDAVEIAQRSNAVIVAVAEVASFFSRRQVKTEPMNIGGAIYVPVSESANLPKAQILAVQAPHSSTMPDGSAGGNSVGFVLSFPQNGCFISPDKAPIKPMKQTLSAANAFNVYFACDAGLFSEMEWIGELGIDLAVLPIGSRYTMGPAMSLDAINMLKPRYVIPSHYSTWDPISQDAVKWSEAVREYTQAEPLLLTPGQVASEGEDGLWR